MIRTTLIGGLFFLLPFAVIIIVLGKVFQVSRNLTAPIAALIPLDRIGALAVADLIGVLFLVLICFLAGLLARRPSRGGHHGRLDRLLSEMVPQYAIAKLTLSGITRTGEQEPPLKPILIAFDDYQTLALEVERSATGVVAYVPGAPNAWSGSTLIVDAGRVSPLSIQASGLGVVQRAFGKGTLRVLGG